MNDRKRIRHPVLDAGPDVQTLSGMLAGEQDVTEVVVIERTLSTKSPNVLSNAVMEPSINQLNLEGNK